MAKRPIPADAASLRPLTARSFVLSLLLGSHPASLPARTILGSAEIAGISETALRAALSRLVTAGDLERQDGNYALPERLLERQRRQDEAAEPSTRSWDGQWEIAVISAGSRSPAARAELRATLTALRLAELREGVWMRPANLDRSWPEAVNSVVTRIDGTPEEDALKVTNRLWDLAEWTSTARHLLTLIDSAGTPALRFAAVAVSVRHLLTDPALPEELLPPDWPGPELRKAYADYRDELIALRPPD